MRSYCECRSSQTGFRDHTKTLHEQGHRTTARPSSLRRTSPPTPLAAFDTMPHRYRRFAGRRLMTTQWWALQMRVRSGSPNPGKVPCDANRRSPRRVPCGTGKQDSAEHEGPTRERWMWPPTRHSRSLVSGRNPAPRDVLRHSRVERISDDGGAPTRIAGHSPHQAHVTP